MSREDKNKIIRGVYYDTDHGFGSIANTYKQSKQILNSITFNDVKEFLERQTSRQTKQYRGYNSYVAKDILQEIQIDLAVFEETEDENDYKYAFMAIDIFSKKLWSVPIQDKKTPESIRAFKEVIEKIGIPEQIYHDQEGAWKSHEFLKLLEKHNIKQITTNTPPPFIERAIQTIKNMIFRRLDGLDKPKTEWIDVLNNVVKKYNNTKHSTIEMTPNEASDGKHNIEVWLNIYNKAVFNRKYPPLKIDNYVRTYVKPKSFTKGWISKWSKDIYKVIDIIDGDYYVEGANRKVYLRHELLKIEISLSDDVM